MKKTLLTLAAALCALALSAATPISFSSCWETRYNPDQRELWTSEGEIASTFGAPAKIAFKGDGLTFNFSKKHHFQAKGMKPGDCIEFSAPVKELPKGAWVDISVYMGITKDGGPEDWLCEWYDGKKWRAVEKGVSFHTLKTNPACETSYVKSFQTKKAVKGNLKVRLRVLSGGTDPESEVYFMTLPRVGAYLAASTVPVKETKRVLFLGNSFTFFGGSNLALLEICHSQGKGLDVAINVKGGLTFGQHMGLVLSREAIAKGGFDAALLQNKSQSASFYDSDPVKNAYLMDDAKALAEEVRHYSPKCRLILERTWASPKENWRGYGSAEAFDGALQRGSEILAPAMGAELSPIGNAFILAREEGLDIYWTDNFHQNITGAYLKACVNYLVLFGEPFKGEVSSYCLDPSVAAKCREIAEKTVGLSK